MKRPAPLKLAICFFLTFALFSDRSLAIPISTVPIGSPGNASDDRYPLILEPEGAGSVGYHYRIGKTEISNAQYAAFLNDVAADDPYGLFDTNMAFTTEGGIIRLGVAGSYRYQTRSPRGLYTYEDKPVVHVDWFDTLRFANWLHNGRSGSGTTEDGAYTLLGGTPTPSNAESIERNPGARFWLPNLNEWYKAAYYDAELEVYYDYPTGTNEAPDNRRPDFDRGNSANFFDRVFTTGNSNYPMVDVDSYEQSASPFGTVQQGGNAWELTETYLGPNRLAMGAGWQNRMTSLKAPGATIHPVGIANGTVGFRIASIPEPATAVLLGGLASFGLLLRRPYSAAYAPA